MQLQPSSHIRSAPPLDADLGLTAVTPIAFEIGLLLFSPFFFWSPHLHLHAPPFLSLPWRHRTAWMRTAFFSGGDLRVTRAASPRCAWAKRTEQVKGEEGLERCTHVGCLSPDQRCVLEEGRGWIHGWMDEWMVGDVRGAPNLGCVCKRASFYFYLSPS